MPILESIVIAKIVFAGLAAIGAVAIVVKILEWAKLKGWFRDRTALKKSDKHNIALTIRTAKQNGRIGVVQGIFNEETEELVDGQEYETEELDDDLKKIHGGKDVVIYK